MEIHFETRPQTNFVIGSPRAGRAVFSKFVWLPSIVPSFFSDDLLFKALCLGLRAYAVSLEAL